MNCSNPLTPQRRTRWWQKLALAGAALLVGLGANAQVNAYSFAQTSGTYVAITGGTAAAMADDAIRGPYTIPSFTFDGVAYTQMRISTNGFLTLGTTAPSGALYIPLNGGGAYPHLAPFGRDLNTSVVAGAAPGIRWEVIGNEIIVQWTDIRRYNIAGERLSCQVRMNTVTGNVAFVYGGSIVPGASTTYPQVGIRGTATTNFANRQVLVAGSWDASTTGTINNQTCYFNNATPGVIPASGQTYTWSVPPPPTCQVPTGVSVNNITTGSADVNFTCTTCDGNYIVEYGLAPFTTPGTAGTAGVGGTVVTGTASPIALTGLSVSSNYVVYVREDCGAGDYSSNTVAVPFATACNPFTIPFSQNFNTASVPAAPVCWTVVNVNGSNTWNTQTLTGNGFTGNIARYNWNGAVPADDWLISPNLQLTGGVSYRVRYRYAASGFNESMDVWWGNGATVGAMTNLIVDHGTFSFSPSVVVEYDFTPPTDGTYNIGWHAKSTADQFDLRLDDIEVVESPSCLAPTAVSVTNVGTTSADVNFTCTSCGGNYIVEYGLAPFTTPGTEGTAGVGGTVVTGTGSPIALAGLVGSSNYVVYVREDCGSGEYSANTAAATFSTACPPFSIPFNENFNTATLPAVPTCWTVVNVNGSTTWNTQANTTNGFTGNIARYNWDGAIPANDWLISPDLDLLGGVSYRVRYRYAASGFNESMDVWWGDGATVGAMTNLIVDHGTFSFSASVVVEYDFVPPTDGTYNIGWHATSAPDQFDLRLDDIQVELSPTCLSPTGITITALSPTTVDLSWTDANTPASLGYDWELRSSGAAGSGATGLDASGSGPGTTANATGLTANTN
ncbi:MAG: choice-of-anchor J domain-containing protein, partial [Flavobacteriales bacterium]